MVKTALAETMQFTAIHGCIDSFDEAKSFISSFMGSVFVKLARVTKLHLQRPQETFRPLVRYTKLFCHFAILRSKIGTNQVLSVRRKMSIKRVGMPRPAPPLADLEDTKPPLFVKRTSTTDPRKHFTVEKKNYGFWKTFDTARAQTWVVCTKIYGSIVRLPMKNNGFFFGSTSKESECSTQTRRWH